MSPAARVLIASGAIGFALGAVNANWHVAVETAQVIAGVVAYPADNPFFVYHVKLWCVLHQFIAPALKLGVSEAAISHVVSGALGMISCQALALCAFAFARSEAVALGVIGVVIAGGGTNFGVIYPVSLIGTSHTYGAFGLSAIVLAMAAAASGMWRLAGALAPACIAFHPALGAWGLLLFGIAAALDWRRLRPHLFSALPWFALGAAFTLASFLLYLAQRPALPAISGADAHRYLATFIDLWDVHRRPIEITTPGVFLNIVAAGTAVAALRWSPALSVSAALLLRFLAVSAVFSLVVAAASKLPTGTLPDTVLIMMPGRLLNIAVMTLAAVLIGLAASLPSRVTAMSLVILTTTGVLVSPRSNIWNLTGMSTTTSGVLAVLPLTLAALAITWFVRRPTPGASETRDPALESALRAVVLAIFAAAGIATAVHVWQLRQEFPARFADHRSDPLLARVASDDGLVITGGELHLIQLLTRRPVLIDAAALDALPYALESGPSMERVLRDVYDVEFFTPPPEAFRQAGVPPALNLRTWQTFTLERWRTIRRAYNARHVLTPGSWDLPALALIASNGAMKLYEIPE